MADLLGANLPETEHPACILIHDECKQPVPDAKLGEKRSGLLGFIVSLAEAHRYVNNRRNASCHH